MYILNVRTTFKSNGRDVWRIAGHLCKFIQMRDTFTSEDFTAYARARGLIGKTVSRHLGNALKGFASAAVIVKSDRFKTSKRNSAPLPVWQTKQ